MCVYIVSKVRWAFPTENACRIPSSLQRAPCVPPRLHVCPRCAGKLRLGAREGKGGTRRAFGPSSPALSTAQAWGLAWRPPPAPPARPRAWPSCGPARPGAWLVPGLLCPASGARALPDPAPPRVFPLVCGIVCINMNILFCLFCLLGANKAVIFPRLYNKRISTGGQSPGRLGTGDLGGESSESQRRSRRAESASLSGSPRREEGRACPTSAAGGGFHSARSFTNASKCLDGREDGGTGGGGLSRGLFHCLMMGGGGSCQRRKDGPCWRPRKRGGWGALTISTSVRRCWVPQAGRAHESGR